MQPAVIFNIHLVLGYAAWALCFGTYIWPRLRSMDVADANRAIATLPVALIVSRITAYAS